MMEVFDIDRAKRERRCRICGDKIYTNQKCVTVNDIACSGWSQSMHLSCGAKTVANRIRTLEGVLDLIASVKDN